MAPGRFRLTTVNVESSIENSLGTYLNLDLFASCSEYYFGESLFFVPGGIKFFGTDFRVYRLPREPNLFLTCIP